MTDIVQRLRVASSGMRSHYKVGAVELIPAHTMDEAADEIERLERDLEVSRKAERANDCLSCAWQAEAERFYDAFQWIENQTTLHQKVDILYVVDGFLVTLFVDDTPITDSFHGETVLDAIKLARRSLTDD